MLYVDGERSGAALAEEIERGYPSRRQRYQGMRLIVRPVTSSELLASPADVMSAFAKSVNQDQSSKLFVRLSPPFLASEKEFRQSIDRESKFSGASRALLLRRVVVIVGVAVTDRDVCGQLQDEWRYSIDNFSTQAVAIDDSAFARVIQCLPTLIQALAPANR